MKVACLLIAVELVQRGVIVPILERAEPRAPLSRRQSAPFQAIQRL